MVDVEESVDERYLTIVACFGPQFAVSGVHILKSQLVRSESVSSLVSFAQHVEEVLQDASRERHWTPEESDSYMAAFMKRNQQFAEVAKQLNMDIIRPRLETVAGYFVNASMRPDEPPNGCSCWFGYCERFPATTKVSFAIEHDARFEKLIVHTETYMMPVFLRFNEQDNLPLAFDEVDDQKVAAWVEERLLEFVADYLRIDRGGEDYNDDMASDPVCGMRIGRSAAAGSDSYYGHPYFFCSAECLARFRQDPKSFTRIKTM